MKCPHCKKELDTGDVAFNNAYHYGGPNLMKVKCCGKLIVVRRVISYGVDKYVGARTKDDWER